MTLPCGPLNADVGPPPNGPTRLITAPNIKHRFNAIQETDARTALSRGLKEYVEQLQFELLGRTEHFISVYETWAAPEDDANYPSASINSTTKGKYDASKFQVQMPQASNIIAMSNGLYPVSPCEYTLDMMLTVWAEDSVQREALCAMLEKELNPLDWRYGLLLELPFYFNQRATYEVMDSGYADNEDDVQRRRRKAEFTIRGCVPVTRVEQLPQAKIRTNTTVNGQ